MEEDSSIENKTKYLFEIIKRYDTYIGSTNTKCTIVMSYCAAVIGFIMLLLNRIISPDAAPVFLVFAGIFSIIVIASSIVCMWIAMSVIFPVTFSDPKKYRGESLIFFGDVCSASKDKEEYFAKIKETSETAFCSDLAGQVYSMSKIVSEKFQKIKILSLTLLYLNFIPAAILLIGCAAQITFKSDAF
ncbi:Pycsar system effector family protein [Pseudomonas soli]|uniref:Pycsar system effector family protein n=1 Tax=Pseudomonas soli TaxID=1306993 RepID=UPI0003C7CAF6|nr:Pycsar system effector family protein [Pseudomonas soli]AIN59408.1 hypothetical protein O165_014405 [Pseudomonas soli]